MTQSAGDPLPQALNHFMVGNPPTQTGWRCPVCNIGVAPWVQSCPNCVKATTTVSTYPTVTGGSFPQPFMGGISY